LDGTIWGGSAFTGIVFGSRAGLAGRAFLAFQRQIKALAQQGLLLAVCSLNDPRQRAGVRRRLPEVAVPELPLDPRRYIQALKRGGWLKAYFEAEAPGKDREQALEPMRLEDLREAIATGDIEKYRDLTLNEAVELFKD
jgi:predicted enzyme involved in methoxymalonyl-ACP biosynthesis